MDWRGHLTIGFVFGLLVAIILVFSFGILDLFQSIVLVAFATICSLIPDLDHDVSKGRALLDYGFVFFAFLTTYLSSCGGSVCIPSIPSLPNLILPSLALIGVYFLIFRFLKPRHRGITHTLVACLVFSVFIYVVLGFEFALFGLAGYFSHLVADAHIRLI